MEAAFLAIRAEASAVEPPRASAEAIGAAAANVGPVDQQRTNKAAAAAANVSVAHFFMLFSLLRAVWE